MYRQGTDERRADAGYELTLLLRSLMTQYRDLREGKAPERIYASPDIFASLEREKDPSFALKRPGPGYTFEGASIEPKLGQSLPFVLRP
jgi:hypothetical protein